MLMQIHGKQKLIDKIMGSHGQKWVWPLWSRDSKIGCISRTNNGINWFFACWYNFRKAKSYFFGGGDLLGLVSLKSAVSQKWIDVWSYFFNPTLHLTFKCQRSNTDILVCFLIVCKENRNPLARRNVCLWSWSF